MQLVYDVKFSQKLLTTKGMGKPNQRKPPISWESENQTDNLYNRNMHVNSEEGLQ